MGYAKDMYMAEHDRWCEDYINGKIDRKEMEQFLVGRYHTAEEINELIHALDQDRGEDEEFEDIDNRDPAIYMNPEDK